MAPTSMVRYTGRIALRIVNATAVIHEVWIRGIAIPSTATST